MTAPTNPELKAMWQLHAADIGGIFHYARAVLDKWGTLRADKIVIPTDTMEQEFQQHYRRGYEAGKKASTPQHTQQPAPDQAAEPVATQWLAEMVMSDCGCSTENQRLLDRIIDRIQQYDRANAAPQPVAREPLTPERVKEIVRGAGYDQCGIPDTERAAFINGLRHGDQAHGIKGGQHVS